MTEGDHETSFRQLPWIHPQIDPRIQQFFNQYGRYLRLKQGASIFNGGDAGEIALVLCGLGVFSFPDKHLKNHYLSLIPPGSLMGDVDGLTHESVNVYDSAFRDSEVRLIKRDIFRDFLIQNPELLHAHTLSVIAHHESCMEALIANSTFNASRSPSGSLRKSGGFFRKIHREKSFVSIPLTLTAVELSAFVNASRQSVSSVHTEIESNGDIVRKKGETQLSKKFIDGCFDWLENGAQPSVRIRKRRENRQLPDTFGAAAKGHW